MINKTLVAGIVSLGLVAGITPAKADMGVAVGVGVVMGIVGYWAGNMFGRQQQDPPVSLKYRYQGNDPVQLCMNQYKSYEPQTGMITRLNGTKEKCPYLR